MCYDIKTLLAIDFVSSCPSQAKLHMYQHKKVCLLVYLCRMSSLAAVCEVLLISYSLNIIDEVEFALLYDANQSKPIFPYSKFERFNIND